MAWIRRLAAADNSAHAPAAWGTQPSLRALIGDQLPQEDDLHYCERRIAEEERLAHAAGSWEAGLVHDQTAMLYRAQLATLRRSREDAQG